MRWIPDECPATRREIATADTNRNSRSSSAWASLASALIDLHLYRDARSALKHLDKTGSDHPYVVNVTHGRYHNALGELRLAERWYRKAAAKEPAALVFVGAVLARQGRLAEAKRCHQRAARAPDSDWIARDEAYFNRGLLLRAERRYRAALRCLDRAVELDPKYAAALEARTDVLAALHVEVPHDHSMHWRQMLDTIHHSPATCHELTRAYTKRYPKRFAGWMLFAKLLAGYACYQEAAAVLRRAVKLARAEEWKVSPEDRFEVQWGPLHLEKKDYRRAVSSFRRAVVLRPTAANLTDLAEVLIIQGRFAAAQPILRRAIRANSEDVGFAHYQLGLIARARREYPDALKYFETAIRCYSPFPLARVARRDVREAMKVVGRTS